MKNVTKKQILSGLHLGVGIGGFLVGGMLMGSGLGRIAEFSPTAGHIFADWIAWAEIVLAATILLLTARTWQLLLAGYLLFGALKGFILFATGSFPSRGFSTRVEVLVFVFYCITTLMLMFRFAQNPPTVLDRVALTVYLFCLWPAGVNSAFSWWQAVGLAALLSSWCAFRWRTRRHGNWATPAKPD